MRKFDRKLACSVMAAVLGSVMGMGVLMPRAEAVTGITNLEDGSGEKSIQTAGLASNKGAKGDYSVAIGDVAVAYGNFSVAMGNGAQTGASYTTNAGGMSTVGGQYAVAMGNGAKAYAEGSVAFGSSTAGAIEIDGGTSVVTVTGGSYAFAAGKESIASGDYSVAIGNIVFARGISSVALGSNSSAKGDYSVALGDLSIAAGNESVAIGGGSKAYGKGSVAFGKSTAGLSTTDASKDTYAFAVGNGNETTGLYSVAIGEKNISSADYAIMIGKENTATSYSVAMGNSNQANGDISVAVGYENIAKGGYSVAMGYKNKTEKNYSVAMGKENTAGYGSVAMGESSIAGGQYSVAMGKNAHAGATWIQIFIEEGKEVGRETKFVGGEYAVAMGNGAKAYADGSVAFGSSTAGAINGVDGGTSEVEVTGGSYAFAAGNLSKAIGNYSVAMGSYSIASGESSVAMGCGSTAGGAYSIAVGYKNNAYGQYSVAIGYTSKAYGLGSVAFGNSIAGVDGTDANKKTYAFAAGYQSVANGDYSVAMGYNNMAAGTASVAMGNGAKALVDNSFTFGGTVNTEATNGIALGYQSSVAEKATNSVALGAKSVAAGSNEVSVGKSGAGGFTRKITNVTAGTADTDAVNYKQLKDATTNATTMGTTAGNIYKANDNVVAAVKSIDTKIGSIASGTYACISAGGTVSANLIALDGAVKTLQDSGIDATKVAQIETNKNNITANKSAIDILNGGADTVGSVANSIKNAFDTKVGTIAAGTYNAIKVTNTVSENLIALDSVITGVKAESFFEKSGTGDDIKLKTKGKISNVADGELSLTSTDVVTGKQLFATNTNVTNNANAITAIQQYVTDEGLNAKGKKITNVANGTSTYDAVNYGQYQELANQVDRNYSIMKEDIGRVGANAAALASLHPQAMRKGESQVMAGMGRYHGKTGAAVGLAWQPDRRVMLSGGFADAAGEMMFNLGLSYKFGQRSYTPEQLKELTSGTGMPLYVAELNAAMKSKDAQIMNLKADNAAIKQKLKRMDAMEAELAQLKAVVAELTKNKR